MTKHTFAPDKNLNKLYDLLPSANPLDVPGLFSIEIKPRDFSVCNVQSFLMGEELGTILRRLAFSQKEAGHYVQKKSTFVWNVSPEQRLEFLLSFRWDELLW